MIFDDASLPAISAELGIVFAPEPYAIRGAIVYGSTIQAHDGGLVRIILWPSIGRVDVRTGKLALTLRNVDRVDVYPGVEVTFRRKGGGLLFVTRSGQVMMAV